MFATMQQTPKSFSRLLQHPCTRTLRSSVQALFYPNKMDYEKWEVPQSVWKGRSGGSELFVEPTTLSAAFYENVRPELQCSSRLSILLVKQKWISNVYPMRLGTHSKSIFIRLSKGKSPGEEWIGRLFARRGDPEIISGVIHYFSGTASRVATSRRHDFSTEAMPTASSGECGCLMSGPKEIMSMSG